MERPLEAVVERRNKKRRKIVRKPSLAWDLPPELWLEVLSRISVRPLVSLRPVCKLFSSLIPFDPLLVDLHLRHHQSRVEGGRTHRLLFLEQWGSGFGISSLHSAVLQVAGPAQKGNAASLEFKSCISTSKPYSHIIPPCRGIVGAFGEDLAFLCNPATREWLCFSKPPEERGERLHIGWDEPNAVFKVVRVVTLKGTSLRQYYRGGMYVPISFCCEICTLDEDCNSSQEGRHDVGDSSRRYNNHLRPCWTPLADSTNPLGHISRECFHGDGSLCWAVRASPCASGFTSILSLNLTSETFETTPLPELFHSPTCYTTFQELDGHMCIIYWPSHSEGNIEIWMVKDIKAVSDKNAWFLRCRIRQNHLSMGGLVTLLAMLDDKIFYTCDKEEHESIYDYDYDYDYDKEQHESIYYYDLLLEEPTPVPWDEICRDSFDDIARLLSSDIFAVYEETLSPIIRREAQSPQCLSFRGSVPGWAAYWADHSLDLDLPLPSSFSSPSIS